MSNVINYSKPSATVFKRGIKDSVHETHNPLVCGGTVGEREREPASLHPGPARVGRATSQDTTVQYEGMGRAPKRPRFKSLPNHQFHTLGNLLYLPQL